MGGRDLNSEVGTYYSNIVILVEHYILGLQIPMLDILCMDVCKDGQDLRSINFGKFEGQLACGPNQVGQGPVAAIVENEVEVLLVLKGMNLLGVT